MTGAPIPTPTVEQPPQPPQPAPTPPTPPTPAPPPAPSPPPSGEQPRTFTQDELNAIVAREKEQERRQSVREVSERLGCTIEEAEQHLKDARERQEAELTEAQRLQKQAEEREARAAAAEAAANQRAHTLRLKEAVLAASVRPERADMAVTGITVPLDADDEAVKAAVEAYKLQVPEFFTTAPPPRTPTTTTPASTPAAPPPPTGKPEEDAFARGAERAKSFRG